MSTASPGSTKSSIQALLRNREQQQSSDSAEFRSAPVDDSSGNSQEDFSYSQKLFHISDGNLYSIFSPIQGRSYGMKPSFLRSKQHTYTESCTTRTTGARKTNHRKGLKFHNFLPSESHTSENTPSSKWRKVHSECRLREEHGTKQITISNWSSHTSPDHHDRTSGIHHNESTEEDCKPSVDPYDFNQCLQPPHNPFAARPPPNKKCSSLDSVLDSLKEKKSQNRIDGDLDAQDRSLQKKHRRKPVQTRRIVPYVQYLSIVEEGDSSLPLDLSAKCLIEGEESSTPPPHSADNMYISKNPHDKMAPTQMNAPPTVLCPPDQSEVSMKKCLRSVVKIPQKRRNQRSAMKQRLEDTFRQNGFLVKTKQVSDGDATFCKFRQLRKYTRYYLKSLEQHLPHEFHKMWKGFLPPKTLLPPPPVPSE